MLCGAHTMEFLVRGPTQESVDAFCAEFRRQFPRSVRVEREGDDAPRAGCPAVRLLQGERDPAGLAALAGVIVLFNAAPPAAPHPRTLEQGPRPLTLFVRACCAAVEEAESDV